MIKIKIIKHRDKLELIIEYEIIISEFERFFVICLYDEVSEFERLLRNSINLKFCLLNYKNNLRMLDSWGGKYTLPNIIRKN